MAQYAALEPGTRFRQGGNLSRQGQGDVVDFGAFAPAIPQAEDEMAQGTDGIEGAQGAKNGFEPLHRIDSLLFLKHQFGRLRPMMRIGSA